MQKSDFILSQTVQEPGVMHCIKLVESTFFVFCKSAELLSTRELHSSVEMSKHHEGIREGRAWDRMVMNQNRSFGTPGYTPGWTHNKQPALWTKLFTKK